MTSRHRRACLIAASCLSLIPLLVQRQAEQPSVATPAVEETVTRMTDVRRKPMAFDADLENTDPWPECLAVRRYLGTLIGYHEVVTWDSRTPDGKVTVTIRMPDGAANQYTVRVGSPPIWVRRPQQ